MVSWNYSESDEYQKSLKEQFCYADTDKRSSDFANGVLNSSKAELREQLAAKQFDDTEMQ